MQLHLAVLAKREKIDNVEAVVLQPKSRFQTNVVEKLNGLS